MTLVWNKQCASEKPNVSEGLGEARRHPVSTEMEHGRLGNGDVDKNITLVETSSKKSVNENTRKIVDKHGRHEQRHQRPC